MKSDLTIRTNFRISLHDAQGRLVDERRVHNIFLDSGRTWLAQYLAYNTTGYVIADPPPDLEPAAAGGPYTRAVTAGTGSPTTADLYGVYPPAFIGLGIGGNQQSGPIPTDVDTAYPGTNNQSDADPTLTGLERPVRVRREGLPVPTWARWLTPVTVSLPGATPYTYTRYTAIYGPFGGGPVHDLNEADIPPGAGYAVVPVSEAALYPWYFDPDTTITTYLASTDLLFVSSQAIAYATFPPVFKTIGLTLTAEWSLIYP